MRSGEGSGHQGDADGRGAAASAIVERPRPVHERAEIVRSWLYAPGSDEHIVERALEAGADAVILDLEDAVAPSAKVRARAHVARALRRLPETGSRLVFVRINTIASGHGSDDLAAIVRAGVAGIRVPKVETGADVRDLSVRIGTLEAEAGRPIGSVPLVCTIESARGVARLAEIVTADARVMGLAFGEADYLADVGAVPNTEGLTSLYARSALVVHSRAAGLLPPVDGASATLDDVDAIEASTRRSRALGFFGRAAIHPRQLPAIHRAFTPDAAEIRLALSVIRGAGEAARAGRGADRLADGTFVDAAVVRRHERVLRLARALDLPIDDPEPGP